MLEKSIRLTEATRVLLPPGHGEEYFGSTAKIVAASARFVLLVPVAETWLLSIELETMEGGTEEHEEQVCSRARFSV